MYVCTYVCTHTRARAHTHTHTHRFYIDQYVENDDSLPKLGMREFARRLFQAHALKSNPESIIKILAFHIFFKFLCLVFILLVTLKKQKALRLNDFEKKQHCPMLVNFQSKVEEYLKGFSQYKVGVPVYGCIILV